MTSGIEPGEVKFGEGKKPVGDELPTGPTQKPSQNSGRIISDLSGLEDTLNNSRVYNERGECYNESGTGFELIKSEAAKIAPYCIILKPSIQRQVYQINVELKPEVIGMYLEKRFGSDITQTDIWKLLGLDNGAIDEDVLAKMFPELSTLYSFHEKYGPIIQDHRLTIFTLPFDMREFFLKIHNENKQFQNIDKNMKDKFYRPITLDMAIEMARKTGDLHRVGKMMMEYNCD